MATKPLLINATQGYRVDSPNKWVPISAPDAFISSIETSDGSETASLEQFNTLVSGVPSPWARIKLTVYALTSESLSNEKDKRTLVECYRHLRSEWRGLMATYILCSDRFILSDPIPLFGRTIEETYGRFDVRSILGQMLYDDAVLWKYTSDTGKNEESAPKIQFLYYKDPESAEKVLVGATSPYTIFFASTNYSMSKAVNTVQKRESLFWIDDDGKFADPTSESFRKHFSDIRVKNDFRKIVLFLNDVKSCRNLYRDALINVGGEEIRSHVYEIETILGTIADEWIKDIIRVCPEANAKDLPVSINDAAKPSGPLYQLFNKKYTYYWACDNAKTYFFSMTETVGSVKIDNVQDLFIDSKYIIGLKCAIGEQKKFENAPVTYLMAEDKAVGTVYYCSLPFSRFAIEHCMKNEIAKIVKGESLKVKLLASVNSNTLKVVLRANIGDQNEEVDIVTKEFIIVEPDSIGHVITWPNFASNKWTQYYYYSEYPMNGSGIKVLPVFKSVDMIKGKVEGVSDSMLSYDYTYSPMGEGDDSTTCKDDRKKRQIVTYPIGKVDSSAHRYEIIKSPYPLSFIQIMVNRDGRECIAGHLIVKAGENVGNNEMHIISQDSLKYACVGIDYGSTNTCAYYCSDEKTYPIPFNNRRLVLFGFDSKPRELAQKNELLFISNEEPINNNGQVKSWLHEHNDLYINTSEMQKTLVGGVPVNETNIVVKSIDENFITTNAGVLCNNMKWLSDANERKQSYMSTLWLMICADLFSNKKQPEKLYWSYPSAMGESDKDALKKIFEELCKSDNMPIDGAVIGSKNLQSHTESEAVCSYALTKKISLDEDKLFVGIDIGGSTSDILVLGKNESNGRKTLMSQCSIRLAANHFFNAINSSARFRNALYRFHESKITGVKVINISDVISKDKAVYSRAPYYLNNVFDQLRGGNEFRRFYNFLSNEVPFAFSLPAYITGILVFYAGLLVRHVIMTQGLKGTVNEIHMRYYGKGGRTFEWIYGVYEEKARRFYARCFKTGLGDDSIKYYCDNVKEGILSGDLLENKSEVAIGLVNLKSDIDGVYSASVGDDDEAVGTTVPKQFLSEVFGEKGFSYSDDEGNRIDIDEMDITNGEFFRNIHCPKNFENFSKYMELFTNFMEETGIINDTDEIRALRTSGCEVKNVVQYYDNDKEYAKYLEKYKEYISEKGKVQPSYRMPVFIAEALYYLEKVLLPEVFKE